VPTIGYISPRVIATCLVALPNLKHLDLEFPSPDTDANDSEDIVQSSPPLPTRGVLRSLASFYFEGVTEYLEDLLAQIDASVPQTLSATFHDNFIHIPPQLPRFIDCAERPRPPIRAVVELDYRRFS
jgi:hypothetical protein